MAPTLTVLALVALSFAVSSPFGGVFLGCSDLRPKSEAALLLRGVEDLRNAPNEHKREPLERLRAMACHRPEMCSARDACVDAFSHHVRGVELGQRIQGALAGLGDSGARSQAEAEALGRLLVEMNIEVEEGRERMPLCDKPITDLRIKYRL